MRGAELRRLSSRLRRNPRRKRCYLDLVLPQGSVNFSDSSESFRAKPVRQPHQGGPARSMHIGYFATDEPAGDDVRRSPHRARATEDDVPLRMRPPITADGFSGDSFSQTWRGTAPRFQHNAVRLHKRECFAGRHRSTASGFSARSAIARNHIRRIMSLPG